LLGEMVAQARARRDIGLEIWRIAIFSAGADGSARPARGGKARLFQRRMRGRRGYGRTLRLESVS